MNIYNFACQINITYYYYLLAIWDHGIFSKRERLAILLRWYEIETTERVCVFKVVGNFQVTFFTQGTLLHYYCYGQDPLVLMVCISNHMCTKYLYALYNTYLKMAIKYLTSSLRGKEDYNSFTGKWMILFKLDTFKVLLITF